MLRDLILREETTWHGLSEVDAKPVAWNVNGRKGVVVGVEPELAVCLGAGLSLAGQATWTHGEQAVGAERLPLTRIPPPFGRAALRWDVPWIRSWSLRAETWVRAAARQDRLSPGDERDVRIPEGGTPGWWTWNARLAAVPGRGAVATLDWAR